MKMGTADKLYNLIETAIRNARRDGITGMSLANLKQITPTTGLTCPPAEYHRVFPEIAANVAYRLRFTITNG